jgi:uncharacterized protein YdaU (DUF1376 family)
MPLYIADYRADTMHLGAAEHGAYLLLIMHYWQTGSLPTEDKLLARIASMTPKQWKNARPVVKKFFDEEWTHSRIEKELTKAKTKYEQRALAGKRGGEAKAKNKQPDSNASDPIENSQSGNVATSYQPQPQPQRRIEKKDIRVVASATHPNFFDEFWKAYPRRKGANPKVPARKKFEAIVRSGTDSGEVIASAKKYAEEIRSAGQERSIYVAQALTWLNQQRWKDYSTLDLDDSIALQHGLIRLVPDTPQWEAWTKFKGKSLPTDAKGGWWSKVEWPPGYESNMESKNGRSVELGKAEDGRPPDENAHGKAKANIEPNDISGI